MSNTRSIYIFPMMLGVFLYAGLLGIVTTLDQKTGVILALLPLLTWVTLRYKFGILAIFLLISPLSSSPFLDQRIMGITGVKPFNIVAFITLIFLLIREGNILNFKDPLEKKTLIILFVYFMFFSVSFFRSIQNLSLFHQLDPIGTPSSVIKYILSFYVKPSLSLISFLVILKTARKENEIESIVSLIAGTMFILSCIIIIIASTHLGEFSQNRVVITELCEKYLGTHYNGVGAIYTITGPVLLYKALGKNRFWFVNFVLAFFAILFLQSRTTLLTFCGGIFLLLFLTKKMKPTFFLAGILFLAIFFLLPKELFLGFMSGFDEGTADAVLSGRISGLWIPLTTEWVENPVKLFFGAGSYGIKTSKFWADNIIFQVIHAHNAYLNFFLDNGIILLSLLLYFLFTYLVTAWRVCKKIDTPLCWALFVVIIAYFIYTLTDGVFHPNSAKVLLFPSIAALINLIRIHVYRDYIYQS